MAKNTGLKINVNIDNMDIFQQIAKDRLDFGFDSIYFRYAEVVEELSWLKLKEERSNSNMNFDRKRWADGKKMHFYNCLEQLLHAHEDIKNDTHK